jgi:formate dehydrogenase major subunit/formate dehydrogenase alpha subunit
MDEIASLVPSYGGINYERLEQGGIQWPCPTKDHPGTETLYTESFLRKGGRALFVSLDQKGPGEVPDEDYPFMLITGRRREHYNNGSMTRRSSGIMELVPDEMLEINPEDAEVLNIRDGEMVRVTSRRGWIDVRARITERSQKGNLFLTFHFPEANSNVLTTDVRDPITGTPEYKCTAVRVERL